MKSLHDNKALPLTSNCLPLTADGSPLTKLFLEEPLGIDRINEPITVGIPFPIGMLKEGFVIGLRDPEVGLIPIQTRTLATWVDGSAKWVLIDFQASVKSGSTKELGIIEGMEGNNAEIPGAIVFEEKDDCLCVKTGPYTFFLNKKVFKPFDRVLVNETEVLESAASRVVLGLEDGIEYEPIIESLFCETAGPLRTTIKVEGAFKYSEKKVFARFFARLHFFANSSLVKVDFTIHNPRAAKHPGGLWDLGDPASIYFKDLSIIFALKSGGAPVTGVCKVSEGDLACGSPPRDFKLSSIESDPSAMSFELSSPGHELIIYQDSSGGLNWKSRNHVNRNGEVKNTFKGYRIYRNGEIVHEGARANPVLLMGNGKKGIAAAIQHFWQNFPKALEIEGDSLIIRLFPKQYSDVFELQGGEQKTHTFCLDFSPPLEAVNESANGLQLTACEGNKAGLEWIQTPLIAHASPEWYAESKAIPYLIPESEDPNREVVDLINTAIEGENTFFDRREIIDEYGWRNFGEFYADHEAIFQRSSHQASAHGSPLTADGTLSAKSHDLSSAPSAPSSPLTADGLTNNQQPVTRNPKPQNINQQPGTSNQPLISHYNNQYDCINGTLTQFMRSGNLKWFVLGDQLCRHVKDIDIYHTTEDRPGFNRGLFWHTEHYLDARTATHRCFSKNHASHRNLASYGGGPSLSHNYSSGLLLHYYLTGESSSMEAMLDLASFVENNLAMESTISNRLFQKMKGIKNYLQNRSRKNGFVEIGKVYELNGPGRASGNALNTLLDAFILTKDDKFLDLAENLIQQCVHPGDDVDKMDLLDTENRWMYTVFLQSIGKYLDVTGEASKSTYAREHARKSLIHYANWMVKNEYLYLDKPEKLEFPNETWAFQDIRKCNVLLYASNYSDQTLHKMFLEKAEFFYRKAIGYIFKFNTITLTRPIALIMQNGMIYCYWEEYLLNRQHVHSDGNAFKSNGRFFFNSQQRFEQSRSPINFSFRIEKQFWEWHIFPKLKELLMI